MTEPREKSNNKTIVLLAIALAAALLVGAFLIWFFSQDSDDASDGSNDLQADGNPVVVEPENLTRTVMIYIIGSDLESRGSYATEDINEMLSSGVDTTRNNVLLFTGGATQWHMSEVAADQNCTFKLNNGKLELLATQPIQSMVETATLTSFLQYAKANFPADEYSLILWDHGGGPLLGYGVDEYDTRGVLSLADIATALDQASFKGEEKLELLGYDACLMGSVETAWYAKDYADYFVASQESEPGCGWDYKFLGQLTTCVDGRAIGEKIVDSYFEGYDELVAEEYIYSDYDVTLSCLDLSKIAETEQLINQLFSQVDGDLNTSFGNISRIRGRTKSFASDFVTSADQYYDLVDLVHMISLLQGAYPEAAGALLNNLNELICYNKTNGVQNAGGVSIYHPYQNTNCVNMATAYGALSFAKEYREYVAAFSQKLTGGSTTSYDTFSRNAGTAVSNQQKSDLKIQLTAEQAADFASAEYFIFKKFTADETLSKTEEYLLLFNGVDATLNSDNTVTATYNGKVVYGVEKDTGEVSDTPLPMSQTGDEKNGYSYYLSCIFETGGENIEDFEIEAVNWQLDLASTPKPLGAYVISDDEEDGVEGPGHANRGLLDPEDYDYYSFVSSAFWPKTDENGRLYFEETGNMYGYQLERDKGFTFEYRDIDKNDGYYAVFLVTDIYGNTYISDFFSLAD